MRRSQVSRSGLWGWGRLVAPAVVLAVLVWRLGTGPFLAGVRSVDGRTLAAGVALVFATTVCCAWRWMIVARGLGIRLSLSAAVAAYYRAMFLNVTLPGGIVGDVHRGLSHGREVSDVGRALRSVGWERLAGQVVQVLVTVVVLLMLPSPVRSAMPLAAVVVVLAGFGVALIARARPAGAGSAWARVRSAVASDIHDGLLARGAWRLGCSARPASVPARASPPRLSTASWCLSHVCRAPSCSSCHGSGVPGLRGGPNRRSASERHMPDRPYTLLSCGMSLDGYLGSASPRRLELSNDADFDRVDAVRASCDAILVGAATVRLDNPRLLVRSETRRDARTARGLPPSPIKVTLTERLELDPRADFFTTGDIEKLVYCASPRVPDARSRLGTVATVIDGGEPVDMRSLSEDLGARGVERLMVEGGGNVHTQFLTDNLVDELQLVVAPFFVGDSRATRFVSDGQFPWNPGRRAALAEVRQIGDVVLLRYALSSRFETR